MTWHEPDGENVRVVRGAMYRDDDGFIQFSDNTYDTDRTAAQKHADEALDKADDAIRNAIMTFGHSLDWARSIGVEIPARVRGVETILRQWQTHLADERKRRG